MTSGFDFFVHRLTCPQCGGVSPDDHSTNMQTYILDHPRLSDLRVGDPIDNPFNDMEDKRYILVSPPSDVCVLAETWNCPHCAAVNWATISLKNQVIQAIEPAELKRDLPEKVNYLSEEAAYLAMALSGQDYLTVVQNGVVNTLLRHLPQ